MFLNSRSYSYTPLIGLFLLLFNLPAEPRAQSCSYSIAYDLIEGSYTDILGKVDPEISEIAGALIRRQPEYGDMEIRIEFLSSLSSRQLVYKNPEDGKHFFKISFKAPAYKVIIRNAERHIIHQETFTEDWARAAFPQDGQGLSSKAALYQRWNDQRTEIYTQLEESYNNYAALKSFLYSLMPAESAVAPAESPSAPDVAPLAPRVSGSVDSINAITRLNALTEEMEFPEVTQLTALPRRKNKDL